MSTQGQTFVRAAARARLELDDDNDRIPILLRGPG